MPRRAALPRRSLRRRSARRRSKGCARARTAGVPLPAAIRAIKESDLKRDLYAMAGDGMRGREAGTLDEMRASMWVADQFRAIGVAPKGEDGTYFQWWNMRRTRISSISSSVALDGHALALWTEITPTSNLGGDVSAPTVFVGDGRDTTIDVNGKVAVVIMQPPTAALRTTTNTYEYRYARAGITATGKRPRAARRCGGDRRGGFDRGPRVRGRVEAAGARRVRRGRRIASQCAGLRPPPAPRLTGTPVLFVHRRALGAFRETATASRSTSASRASSRPR